MRRGRALGGGEKEGGRFLICLFVYKRGREEEDEKGRELCPVARQSKQRRGEENSARLRFRRERPS